MAITLNNTVSVTLNSVNLSDHITSVSINQAFDELEVTAMGDTAHKFAKGLEASTITLDFLNDTAAASVNATLAAAYGTTVPIVIKQSSAAVSATNPSYSTTILVNNLQNINGAVGDISNQSITFTCNSVIVVATS
jgi:predicted secreted protein